jgi:hypothetical protein
MSRRVRSLAGITSGLGASFLRRLAFLRRRKLYASPARFRQTDRDGLLGGAGSMLPFPDMVHFFTNKFSSLRRRSLSRALAFPSTL